MSVPISVPRLSRPPFLTMSSVLSAFPHDVEIPARTSRCSLLYTRHKINFVVSSIVGSSSRRLSCPSISVLSSSCRGYLFLPLLALPPIIGSSSHYRLFLPLLALPPIIDLFLPLSTSSSHYRPLLPIIDLLFPLSTSSSHYRPLPPVIDSFPPLIIDLFLTASALPRARSGRTTTSTTRSTTGC